MNTSHVTAVSLSPTHSFSKAPQGSIRLLAGLGVEGDAHAGAKVKHRYQVKRDPNQPNLCQVHLLQHELFVELNASGFSLEVGQMGENILTRGLDLMGLPTGTRLGLGETAVVEVTGMRTPCHQLNGLQPGLMKACFTLEPRDLSAKKTATNKKAPRAGIMGVVIVSGEVRRGDSIRVTLPPEPYVALRCV
jgi:MOSC domain-containing protein YiiM